MSPDGTPVNAPTPDGDASLPSEHPLRTVLERASSGDRSLMHVLGAVSDAADENGVATLQNVAMHFREAHLAARAQEGRDVATEANRLSLDEVRTHLATSLVPRLVSTGALTLPNGPLQSSESLVQLAPGLWAEVRQHRAEVAEAVRLTDEAHRLSTAANTPSHSPAVTAPFGKTLKATGLSKVYRGRRVVNDVALKVQQGEIVGLLGPNGAGKTTTFYMLVGLIAPLEGRIELEGVDITDMPMYKDRKSVV